MTSKLSIKDLRREYHPPEIAALLRAAAGLIALHYRRPMRYNSKGYPLRLLDVGILLQVFAIEIADNGGVRTSTLVRVLGAPRRTVRDSVTRLEDVGLILRDRRGLYRPTDNLAPFANDAWASAYRKARTLAAAVARYGEENGA